MKRFIVSAMAAIAACTMRCPAQTSDSAFTYQGELRQSGSPAQGTFDMSFSLWDALSGGSQAGATINLANVNVVGGLFTVELDFGAAAFDNSARWLEVVVNGTPLAPRQPITRAPYALQTRGIFVDDAFNVGIGTTSPIYPLHVEMDQFAASKAQVAIFADNQLTTSVAYGLFARSESSSGRGVYGEASASSGSTRGIHGHTASTGGYAGYFTGPQGSRNYFQRSVGIGTTNPQSPLHIEATDVIGIRVNHIAAIPSAIGIYCESDTNTGDAIHGYSTLTVASGAGVVGVSDGSAGYGVRGVATSSTGSSIGVYGGSSSSSGIGVFALATNSNGTNYGLRADTDSDAGYAGYFTGGRNYMEGFLGLNKPDPVVRLDVVGSIQYTGTITDVSDLRLKDNIERLSNALAKVEQIEGVYFTMKDSPEVREVGLIAQNVQQALPEAVRIVDPKAGHLGVSYPSITPLLVEALKDLRAEKDAQINDLREQNAELRHRLERLEGMIQNLSTSQSHP